MKGKIIAIVTVTVLLCMTISAIPALAAKPMNIIEKSNGFPSGHHFNLNLHGRDDGFSGGDSGGKSVFIGISGNSTIEYVSNKKSSETDLYVIDPLAECFDGDPARVFLPYKINIGDEITPDIVSAGGYYVFGRILGKPQNGSEDSSSSILIWPTFVIQSCNCTGDEAEFGNLRECLEDGGDLALGLITTQGNLFGVDEAGFYRFPDPEPEKGKGKGKSKASEITQLFKWSGYVTDNSSLDSNGPEGLPDGYLDEYDVPAAYDTNGTPGIQEDELIDWLEYLESIGEVIHYENEWIFDIADLVVAGQTVTNDGAKLFQIRFYPVNTTEFVSEYMP